MKIVKTGSPLLALTLTLTLALTVAPAAQAADAPLKRLSLDSLSVEQQAALKNGVRTKSVDAQAYCYVAGVRHSLSVEGSGSSAVFRLDGSGSALRHAGRAVLDTRGTTQASALAAQLAPFGLSIDKPLDEGGSRWSIKSAAGLEGLQALNRLQESGLVLSITPDWQRDLRKK